MITDDLHEFSHQYSKIDTVDVETERLYASAMDEALKELTLFLFKSDKHLEEIMELILREWPYDTELDQLNTLYDFSILVRMFPERFDEKYSLLISDLAQKLIRSEHDRTVVYEHVFTTLASFSNKPKALTLIQRRYLDSRNKLVQANMRLVMHLARRYGGKGVELEELIQDGTIGLIKATERYNLNKGYRFTTYAYWWIQQAIKESLSDKRGVVRLPGNINERILKIDRTKQTFFKSNGRFPNRHELQTLTGIDSHHISAVEGIGNLSDSMNEPIYEEGLTLEETHEDELASRKNPFFIEEENSEKIWLQKLIEQLPDRQQFILRLYHGIDIGRTYPFKEIAPQLGITLERTRQLYHESVRSLKELAGPQ